MTQPKADEAGVSSLPSHAFHHCMRVLASPALINRWLNPYNWLLNTHLEREGVEVLGAAPWRVLRGQADIWHVHWPDHIFNQSGVARAEWSARIWLQMAREARRQGVRIVWTVHNLRAHDGKHAELEQAFWTDFLPLVDGFVHLSEAGRGAAMQRFPTLAQGRHWVIPHGHYRSEYVTTLDRSAARRRLGLEGDGSVLLYTGRIRPYKNVPALVDAFGAMEDASATCLITGAPATSALRREVEQLAARDPRVRLDLRHLRRRELAMSLRAADLVVLPYREILNSGSALLSLSLDRPVLVPNRGALAELASLVGEEWVRCYDGELSATTLADAVAWARETPRAPHAPLSAFSWPAIARAHRAAYESLTTDVRDRPLADPDVRQRAAAARWRGTRRLAR